MSGIMFVKLAQGRRQDFTFGPQKLSAEDARIEAPEAPRGLRIGGGGVSPSPTDYGIWGSVVSSSAGSGE